MLVWCSLAAMASRLEPTHLFGVEKRAGEEHLQPLRGGRATLVRLRRRRPCPRGRSLRGCAIVSQAARAGCQAARCRYPAASEPVVCRRSSSPRFPSSRSPGTESRISAARIGVVLDVFAQRGVLAAAARSRKSSARSSTGVAFVAGGDHRSAPDCSATARRACLLLFQNCSLSPGIDDRISLSRFKARM